jgi:FkbM family methyltransferase
MPAGMVVPILQGPLRGKKWIVGSSTHGCWLGSYEYGKQKAFIDEVKPGQIVYDIGANVGFYTLLSSLLVGATGHVVAFEPLPRNLVYLRRHLELNGCANVMVLPVAVSDRPGHAQFDSSHDPSMGLLSDHGTVEVETVALDPLVQSGAIPPPDVIKIDVEGAEPQVLAGTVGLFNLQKPLIFLALHGQDVGRQCRDFLDGVGYQLQSLGSTPVELADEILAIPDGGSLPEEARDIH